MTNKPNWRAKLRARDAATAKALELLNAPGRLDSSRRAEIKVLLQAAGPGEPGRPRRSVAVASERIAIRVTPDELERWTKASAGRPLSEWIRERCNS